MSKIVRKESEKTKREKKVRPEKKKNKVSKESEGRR